MLEEQTEAAGELNMIQFGILNHMPKSQEGALYTWQMDSNIFHIDRKTIESINSTILTSEAVSYIESRNGACAKRVKLISEIDGRFFVTKEGQRYIEYYTNIVLTN